MSGNGSASSPTFQCSKTCEYLAGLAAAPRPSVAIRVRQYGVCVTLRMRSGGDTATCIYTTRMAGTVLGALLPGGIYLAGQDKVSDVQELQNEPTPKSLSPNCNTAEALQLELHSFADASERGYAAVVYLRVTRNNDTSLHLLGAKSKVAPVKQVTLPRLELNAAALLTDFTSHIRSNLSLSTAPIHLWSDSEVTLHWIRGHASRWKTYVANRVSHIQQHLSEAQWRHVSGRDNPADCASRGIAPSELLDHPLWWTRPTWLKEDRTQWPSDGGEIPDGELPEQRSVALVNTARSKTEPELLLQFSSLHRLLRITAWCCRWPCPVTRAKGQSPVNAASPVLLPAELDDALFRWLRVVQSLHYHAETTAVKANRIVPLRGPLARLHPFLDDNGVLRVGGRLKHATLPHDERHPMIVPLSSWLTRLIVESCHRRTLHGHGDAVHLEAVSDYTTEAFLAAFRRFTSRRGLCAEVFPDCDTNFVGTDRVLREVFRAASPDGRRIANAATAEGIKWHFNPPAAPHFGGLWEAAVKSTKHHLRRVIGETTLTFEELSTFLAQVEAWLNSRPLQALSDDPDDVSALTPGHFLIGAPLLDVPEPSLTEKNDNALSRWQHLQKNA
ncbi:uncharacterized protein [Temnothorax nylanderi]|uniref:uncharacterized protein n=1 Tax=Temnothorax nylanderi TaxID=102681 RepID=UPI003A85CD77